MAVITSEYPTRFSTPCRLYGLFLWGSSAGPVFWVGSFSLTPILSSAPDYLMVFAGYSLFSFLKRPTLLPAPQTCQNQFAFLLYPQLISPWPPPHCPLATNPQPFAYLNRNFQHDLCNPLTLVPLTSFFFFIFFCHWSTFSFICRQVFEWNAALSGELLHHNSFAESDGESENIQ